MRNPLFTRRLSTCLVFLLCALISKGQQAPIPDLSEEQEEALEALALHPSVVQSHIMEASQYPGILSRLAELRKKSTSEFTAMLDDYSESIHSRVYSVSRYADLISMNEQEELFINKGSYPDSVLQAAEYLLENHKDVLLGLERIETSVQSDLDDILSMYPEETSKAYRFLLNYPAVLIVMYRNLELTALIGDYYRQSPLQFAREFEDYGSAIAERNAAQTDDEEGMDKILEELSKRSNQYAKELNKDNQKRQDEQTSTHYTQQPRTRVSVSVGFGYSYWYGYPYWYRYPYW